MRHVIREPNPMFDRTLHGAREAALADRTDAWVNEFLASGLGANPSMAVGLRKQRRWWIGPVLIPIASLARICGPEPDMEYRTSRDEWEARVAEIMVGPPEQLPPIIIEYRGVCELRLCDGSHRHEAMRRRRADSIWALIWCNSESAFREACSAWSESPARGAHGCA